MTSYSRTDTRGFSTLELMIAFAIICIALAGAASANFAAQYWTVASQTSNEGLYKAKIKLEDVRALIKEDFYQVTSTPFTRSTDASDPADQACIAGGLCYYLTTTVTDLSSCSKYVQAEVSWRVSSYPTTTTTLYTNLTNSPEVVALGGDCILNQPAGSWNTTPSAAGTSGFVPGKQFSALDVFHKRIYVGALASPYFQVYDAPSASNQNAVFDGSLDVTISGSVRKINALDVADDLSTGRTYVYAAMNATSSQLAVIDVTDWAHPALISQQTLKNVDSAGSFPQGWRVVVYGSRLYMTTRETTTNEFHIFDISTPTLPTEIGNGYQLNRTVNGMVVRDQKISGVTHRYVYLASDSDLKEIGVLDVTGDAVSEIASVDLPGAYDAQSVFLLGNTLFVGRSSNPSGPELFAYAVTIPSLIASNQRASAEVGADITSIKGSGEYLFLGTSKSGQEVQVWSSDLTSWTGALNVGRLTFYAFSGLAPLGLDIDGNFLFLVSQTLATDALRVLFETPFTL